MTRVGIFGAGRLASAVKLALKLDESFSLSWMADKGHIPADDADVVLDASTGPAVAEHLAWSVARGIPIVIAATGFEHSVVDAYKDNARAGILLAPNLSLAVAFARQVALALGRFSKLYPEAALGVVERHHAAKLDCPSGTAIHLAGALSEGRGWAGGWNQGRAADRAVNIASLRMGTGAGYHELRMETPAESICLTHEAKSREVFARGALMALGWMKGRTGLHSFDDMSSKIIAPLFQ